MTGRAVPPDSLERSGTVLVVVALLVFLTALFGILTRPSGFLAAFWPVNALLMGLFVRRPRLASLPGWAGALIGYLAADLATGNTVDATLRLTAINLAEASSGWALLSRLRKDDQGLRTPVSVLYMFAICAAAAAVAATLACGLHWAQTGHVTGRRWIIWFVSEIASLAVTLPVVLAAPGLRSWGFRIRREHVLDQVRKALPLLALLASGVVGILIGGPGVLAFPIPALLWCALNYSVFAVAVLTMVFSVGEILAVAVGVLPLADVGNAQNTMISMRLGVTFLVLGPLTVATINAVRNELVRSLEHAANHDFLTHALSRGAFVQRAEEALARCAAKRQPVALLMLDIDRFKRINDRFGHGAGDRVLATFARTAAAALRETDLFGRIGGEEFAVLLPQAGQQEALDVAERIRASVAGAPTALDDGRPLRVTVSIGLAAAEPGTAAPLDQLLRLADQGLYAAKEAGRNRTVALRYEGPVGLDGFQASQFAG